MNILYISLTYDFNEKDCLFKKGGEITAMEGTIVSWFDFNV